MVIVCFACSAHHWNAKEYSFAFEINQDFVVAERVYLVPFLTRKRVTHKRNLAVNTAKGYNTYSPLSILPLYSCDEEIEFQLRHQSHEQLFPLPPRLHERTPLRPAQARPELLQRHLSICR